MDNDFFAPRCKEGLEIAPANRAEISAGSPTPLFAAGRLLLATPHHEKRGPPEKPMADLHELPRLGQFSGAGDNLVTVG